MPQPEVDPSRPTPPPSNGQHYEEPGTVGMNPQQVIKMMLAQGFAGWSTPIALTRPTQNGPERYETTPAKIIAENTRSMLALNHTLQLVLQGAIQVEGEDEHGNTVIDEVNPIQAIVDLTAAIDQSCDLAENQMNRKPKSSRKRRKA